MDLINLAEDRDQRKALVNTVIKCWEILEWLSDWQFLKKDGAPRELVILSVNNTSDVPAWAKYGITDPLKWKFYEHTEYIHKLALN
jgi:hypothetical protein